MPSVVKQVARALGEFFQVPLKLSAKIGMEEAAFLMYVVWKCDKDADEEGWICKGSEEIQKEIGLSRKVQFRLRTSLRDELKVLEEKENRVAHELYFRINDERLDELVGVCQTAHERVPNGTPRSAESPAATCQTALRSYSEESTLEKAEEGSTTLAAFQEQMAAKEAHRARKAGGPRNHQYQNRQLERREYGPRQPSESRSARIARLARECAERSKAKFLAGELD